MIIVSIHFNRELNQFLSREKRHQIYQVISHDARTIKDLIEAEGIPHTEVDIIKVNGDVVDFHYQIKSGDQIEIFQLITPKNLDMIVRLGRPPLPHLRFVADVNLGKLTKHLRMLGIDCSFAPHWNDLDLAHVSVAEERILLTRDRGLLKRKIIHHGIYIHSSEPAHQIEELVKRINITEFIKPFTRCLACNGLLMAVEKKEIQSRVPDETYRHINEFYGCDQCDKIYWQGAHWQRLHEMTQTLMRISCGVTDAQIND